MKKIIFLSFLLTLSIASVKAQYYPYPYQPMPNPPGGFQEMEVSVRESSYSHTFNIQSLPVAEDPTYGKIRYIIIKFKVGSSNWSQFYYRLWPLTNTSYKRFYFGRFPELTLLQSDFNNTAIEGFATPFAGYKVEIRYPYDAKGSAAIEVRLL